MNSTQDLPNTLSSFIDSSLWGFGIGVGMVAGSGLLLVFILFLMILYILSFAIYNTWLFVKMLYQNVTDPLQLIFYFFCLFLLYQFPGGLLWCYLFLSYVTEKSKYLPRVYHPTSVRKFMFPSKRKSPSKKVAVQSA